ncbi:hypothetical protein QQP08_025168 [Theobroma cacao]|nr:hypothetical protein QQP08_025168 [Theobroma cacao]
MERRLFEAAMDGSVISLLLEDALTLKPELAKKLDFRKESPIHLATSKGYLDIVSRLLQVDPDICLACDRDGRNPPAYCSHQGSHYCLERVGSSEAPSGSNDDEQSGSEFSKCKWIYTARSFIPEWKRLEIAASLQSAGAGISDRDVNLGQFDDATFSWSFYSTVNQDDQIPEKINTSEAIFRFINGHEQSGVLCEQSCVDMF